MWGRIYDKHYHGNETRIEKRNIENHRIIKN